MCVFMFVACALLYFDSYHLWTTREWHHICGKQQTALQECNVLIKKWTTNVWKSKTFSTVLNNKRHTTLVCKSKPSAWKMLSFVPPHLKHLDGTSHHKHTWSAVPKDISPWKRWACSHHLWSASKTWQESCTLPCMSPPPLCCHSLDLETWLSHQGGASSGAWLGCSICSNLWCLNHLQPMTTWNGFLLWLEQSQLLSALAEKLDLCNHAIFVGQSADAPTFYWSICDSCQ